MAERDWQEIWSSTKIDLDQDKKRLNDLESSLRWRRMERLLSNHFGSIEGLKTIEVGSGLGDFSLFFSQRGAEITLSDYSTEALAKGKERFQAHGRRANFVLADMLDVPDELKGKFDVSFSLGLAEHFQGEDRFKIISAHSEVLRPGGLAFISVPYRYSFLYRIWMSTRKRKGDWEYGLEIPFSRTEITELSERAGLKSLPCITSSFFSDWQAFFPHHRIRRLLPSKQDQPSILDAFAYALVYVGEKPKIRE